MSSPTPAGASSPGPCLAEGIQPESERVFLHAILESSPDLIYFKDSQSRFLRINRALASHFGLKEPSEAVGKTDFDFHPREKAEIMRQDEIRIVESGTPMVDKIEREERADGKTVWVITSKALIFDQEGRIVGTFGISRDVTMFKEMEDALGRERNLLRHVIDNVPDYIFAKDTEGRYILNNQAHVQFLKKKSPDDIFGKTSFDLYPPAVAEGFHADDLEVMETGQPILNRIESPAPQRWLSTTKVPLFDPSGTVEGLVAISRDITEQKNSREALEKTVEELRSLQLQLVEAEKMKMVGRLAAGVAHEVKNPLAIIGMGLEYLKSQPFEDSNIPQVLEEIAGAVQRADSVVRELLDFSASQKMNLAPADVNRIVRNALVLVRSELTVRKIVVVNALASELPLVRLDAMKIEQALVNLFSNAAQAMEEGGELTVRTSTRQVTGIGENVSQSDAGRPGALLVIIEVMDTGPGVPEAMLGKVFDPFFTTKPTGKGTGLGLTVTKTIIDLHGGTIEIGNRPEGGTCVTLVLKADNPS